MSKNLAIIGASYLQLPLIQKAKIMGYSTHVFAWAANDVGEQVADYFYPISIVEKDEIAEKCREIGICGICTIATDLGAITVNYVANKLGLIGNSMECVTKSTNKHLMRKAFEKGGDPSPKSILVTKISDIDSLDISLPVIVKPTDRSGSRGIYKVEKTAELAGAIELALSEGFEKKVLIEEFAEGQEYSVEGISYKGEHSILAITLKHTTNAPHFIETGHEEPAPISKELYEKIVKIVKHALNSLEITNGASHSEIKISNDGTIKIIEIGGRMGGDCIGSDLVQLSTGIDYVRAVIQIACGEKPDLIPYGEIQPAEVRFIFTEQDRCEFERIKSEEPSKIIRIVDEHFENIGKTTDSSNRAGCYIIKK